MNEWVGSGRKSVPALRPCGTRAYERWLEDRDRKSVPVRSAALGPFHGSEEPRARYECTAGAFGSVCHATFATLQGLGGHKKKHAREAAVA